MVGTLAAGSVNLALFSPPYCDQRRGHYPGIPETTLPEYMSRLLMALVPKMAQSGSVMIVAREHLRAGQISDVWLRTRLAIRAAGWVGIIWHKPDAPPTGHVHRPRRTWERVMWFSRTSKPFVDLYACGTSMLEKRSRLARPRRKELPHTDAFSRFKYATAARITDTIVASVGGIAEDVDHPAMFPAKLADQLIRTFSPAGGLVADPFCGSGQTLLAARDAGRRWWGCDIVRRYAELAARRLATCE